MGRDLSPLARAMKADWLRGQARSLRMLAVHAASDALSEEMRTLAAKFEADADGLDARIYLPPRRRAT